jgi:hypothetical protein
MPLSFAQSLLPEQAFASDSHQIDFIIFITAFVLASEQGRGRGGERWRGK